MKHIFAGLSVLLLIACSSQPAPPPAAAKPEPPKEISITSKSPQAIEHFKTGRDLSENIRFAESAEEFAEALKLDPDFALAHAYHGLATPGAAGLQELELASKQGAG